MSINSYESSTIIVVLLLFLILSYFLGHQVRKYFENKGVILNSKELGTLEGALLGLFAFFLGFTFSMAGSRFDARRTSIVNEANAISTVISRADLYPDSVRVELRSMLKKYLDNRIEYFAVGNDDQKINAAIIKSKNSYGHIWQYTSKSLQQNKYIEANRLMIPALNTMSDCATLRDAAKNATVPESIIIVLLLLSLCASFIIGYGTRGKNYNHTIGLIFIIMITISIDLIIDLDRPRRGIITLNSANQRVLDLQSMFNNDTKTP